MKIALLQSPTFPLNLEYHGGIERVELGQLDILEKKSHFVRLFVPKLIGTRKNILTLKDFGWKNKYLKWLYYLQFAARAKKFDICHGHYTPELLALLPKKSVLYFHGFAVKDLPLYRYRFFKNRYHKAHYTFCAHWVKEEYRKLYPDIPEKNMHVLHYGCNIEHFRPMKEYKYGQPQPLRLCWYGLWEDPKGVFDLLKAYEIVKHKRNDVVLSLGGSAFYEGDTPAAAEIEKRVRDWANRLNVDIVGKIKYTDLPSFINKHHVGIFPSKYREPFGLVPLEMMSCGLPVIAYDYGGPRECIAEGKTGFLVERGNAEKIAEKIEYFLDNPSQIILMGLAARKHVEQNFTWEKHIGQLLDIYGKLTGDKK